MELKKWFSLIPGNLTALTLALLITYPGQAQGQYPSSMPGTPYPDIKGCSASQADYLKKAWRLAHYYTWRSNKVLDYIQSQSSGLRDDLWSRDYVAASSTSPSPQRWFGGYNGDRAEKARDGINKVLRRFEQRGSVVKGIKTLRCGQPILPSQDEHVDVCPADNPGADGPPGAYHFPVGVIVTCPSFWNQVNNPFNDPLEVKLARSARTLVHETFHWLSIDGKYVTDIHGGKKYYGLDEATTLAEEKPNWAIYNNDNYAWFIYNVGRYERTFSAVWGDKEGSGTGGMFIDLTWNELNSWRSKLSDRQYLADVETYVKNGERKYMAVWRVGPGNGAFWASEWADFERKWKELKKTQDLIDIEVYNQGNALMFLGVYRLKQGNTGDGGLLVGLSWDDLVAYHKQLANVAYLADVETYVQNGQRRFAGVWRPGKATGALYLFNNWQDFEDTKQRLNASQKLIDFEKFISNGKWNYLGVWEVGSPSGGPLYQSLSLSELLEKHNALKSGHTLLDLEEYTALPERVKN